MVLTIDPNDARPIYVQIMDEIRRALVVGSLRADEALPSVRQLASDLRVNPNTVQQSYRELEREGIVYVRRGQGTYAAALPDGRARERRTLAAEVARRALRDAYRHGLDVEDLVAAIRKAAPAGAESRSGGGER
ncbi:MAG: GntR family transcriptional regulator [Longimicrobiales bacterium]